MRIPRKKKKQIPEGFYCYKPTSDFKTLKGGGYGFTVKLCPFYGYVRIEDIPEEDRPRWMDAEYVEKFAEEKTSWCKLIKTDIDDQCKSCSIKLGI